MPSLIPPLSIDVENNPLNCSVMCWTKAYKDLDVISNLLTVTCTGTSKTVGDMALEELGCYGMYFLVLSNLI